MLTRRLPAASRFPLAPTSGYPRVSQRIVCQSLLARPKRFLPRNLSTNEPVSPKLTGNATDSTHPQPSESSRLHEFTKKNKWLILVSLAIIPYHSVIGRFSDKMRNLRVSCALCPLWVLRRRCVKVTVAAELLSIPYRLCDRHSVFVRHCCRADRGHRGQSLDELADVHC